MEIIEYPLVKGLFVSREGVIYSNFSFKKRIIPAHRTKFQYGHYEVIDFKNPQTGLYESCFSHRIVNYTFRPVDNYKDLQVNHKDGNKLNNHPDNLEWVTISENLTHAYQTGLNDVKKKMGELNPMAKLNWATVGIIRDAIDHGFSCRAIGKYFKMSGATIQNIKNNQTWVIH